MMNDERELMVCCGRALYDIPDLPAKARETVELVARALCTFAISNDKERSYITDGQYKNVAHLKLLMKHEGRELADAKSWVDSMLANCDRKGRTYFKGGPR